MNYDKHTIQHEENPKMDYSKVAHSKIDDEDTSMGVEARHDHHKMMIEDFKKRFGASLNHRANRNMHVRRYKEEGTITMPFDLGAQNNINRFHLVIDVIDRLAKLGSKGAS